MHKYFPHAPSTFYQVDSFTIRRTYDMIALVRRVVNLGEFSLQRRM